METNMSCKPEQDSWDDNWDPMEEVFFCPFNTISTNHESSVGPLAQTKALNIKNDKICDHYLRYGNCADGHHCDRLHVSKKHREEIIRLHDQVSGSSIANRLNYSCISPQTYEPSSERLLLITVTNIRNPNLFHLVAPFENYDFSQLDLKDFEFFTQNAEKNSDISRKIQNCQDMLHEMFGKTYRLDNINDPIYPSEVVACRDPDGRFRRAIVLETPDVIDTSILDAEDQYRVYLIDLGIERCYYREDIHDIKAQCLNDPPMALACTLDLKPPACQKEWPEDSLDYFKTLLLDDDHKYLLCKIVRDRVELQSPIDGFKVELYNIRTRQNLANRLISNGFATK